MSNGFTLIELLAVIVILAIILAIAIPSITGITNSNRRSAFESDTKMLLTALDYQLLQATVETEDFEVTDNKVLIDDEITTLGGEPSNYIRVKIVNLDPLKICVETKSDSKFGTHKATATRATVEDLSSGDCTTVNE